MSTTGLNEDSFAFAGSTYGSEDLEETISIRPASDDDSIREVRISCPDANGLGCDVARILLDFGLQIVSGDVSTDGRWCFLIFRVTLASGARARWRLLHQRLDQVCSAPPPQQHRFGHGMWPAVVGRRTGSDGSIGNGGGGGGGGHAGGGYVYGGDDDDDEDGVAQQQAYLMQVSSVERMGLLHDLMEALWEADITVFKAHITTSPSKEVLDLFWIFDNRQQLPDSHRSMEICDRVRKVLGPRCLSCRVDAASPELCEDDSSALFVRRSACKDVHTPATSLRRVANRRRTDAEAAAAAAAGAAAAAAAAACEDQAAGEGRTAAIAWDAGEAGESAAGGAPSERSVASMGSSEGERDEFGDREDVQVSLDNYDTNSTYTLLTLACRDRKGLVYDLMRSLHDVNVRVAYGRVSTESPAGSTAGGSGGSTLGRCHMDLFVQEADGSRITDAELQAELLDIVRMAVALPLRISIRDVFDGTCTELLVTSYLDSGGRGRPRVTYDVTAALNGLQLAVFMADVFYDSDSNGPAAALGGWGRPSSSSCGGRPSGGSSSGKPGDKSVGADASAGAMCNGASSVVRSAAAAGAVVGIGGGRACSVASSAGGGSGSNRARRPQELHRFLVHFPDGRPVQDEAQKRRVYEYVRSYLMGTERRPRPPPQQQ